MALMWCFIGMLLGLFIITITFLVMGLRKKPKKKKLFRLRELESEEGELQSPTIHTTSQFPDPSDFETRQAAVAKLNAKRENGKPASKHFPGMGSLSDLLKTDTSLYINPLWRGWREEYLSLKAQGEETEVDDTQDKREGITRSEPWNVSGAALLDDVDHNGNNSQATSGGNGTNEGGGSSDGDGSSEGDGSSVDSSNSESSQRNNGNDNLGDNNTDLERSKPSTNNTESSRAPTSKKRSVGESDPSHMTSIPVGIPSYPVSDPKIFHTEPTRTKKPEIMETTAEIGNTTKPDEVDDKNHLNGGKAVSSTNDYKNPSNNLLLKFGIDIEDAGATSRVSDTALSSPCLLGDHINQPDSETHGMMLETSIFLFKDH
jgi:hypothetical protein